jgi:putative ABC transport system permease protein
MPAWNNFTTDLRFTLRLLRSSPGFALVAILSLALGIGATSAIFSVVYAVLIDPYPYKNADRIVAPSFLSKHGQTGWIWYTIPDYLEIKANAKTVEDAFLAVDHPFIVTHGLPEQVKGIAFSPDAFGFMGVPAIIGRLFGPADIPAPQAPPHIAVLSYRFWHRHFNGDPGIVGKTIELDHEPYAILGVVPPRFTWSDADVYFPLAMTPDARIPVPLMLRIKPGTGLEALNAELQAMTERFARRDPSVYPKQFRMHVQRLNDWLLGKFQGTLLILLAAVGFLLLIACGNVSILLLARASVRQKEIALRSALGASRARVLQQLLTESVALSLAGGLLGVVLAYRGVPAMVALMPEYSVPHEAAIAVNGVVVLFTFSVSVITGILFGMAPAVQLARQDLRDAMQESGRGVAGSVRAGRTRSLLIVSEVALTVVLLAGAAVAIRGFVALIQTRLGYDPTNVLSLRLLIRDGAYTGWEARAGFYRRVMEQLRNTPGVRSVAATFTGLPPWIGWRGEFEIEGHLKDQPQPLLTELTSEDYFATLHIPMLRGRTFSEAEVQRGTHVAVINEQMARQYWPGGGDPIGARLHVPSLNFKGHPKILNPPGHTDWVEIVGVAATARNRGLSEIAKPAMYIPYTVVVAPGCTFLVRTEGDPHKLVNTLRERVRAVDPDQPVLSALTLDEVLTQQDRAYPQFSTTLFSIFAAVGLLLAATGLFSVVSFVVARRTHEFGIRMALGAQSGDILRLISGMTARLILTGILIGLAASLALSRVTAKYVDGWDPRDPLAFASVATVLLVVALAASWIPARRAMAIQPSAALRHE